MEPLISTRTCILLALLDGPGFGAELASRIAERSGGAVILGDGSLYPAIAKLRRERLVREQPRGSATITRTFELTTKGDEEALRAVVALRSLLRTMKIQEPRAPVAQPAPAVDLAARPQRQQPAKPRAARASGRPGPAPAATASSSPAAPQPSETGATPEPARWIERGADETEGE